MFDGGFYLCCCGIIFGLGIAMIVGTVIVLKATRFQQIGKWMLAGGIIAGVLGLLYGFWFLFFGVLTPEDLSSANAVILVGVYSLITGVLFFISGYGIGAIIGCLIGLFGRFVSRLL